MLTRNDFVESCRKVYPNCNFENVGVLCCTIRGRGLPIAKYEPFMKSATICNPTYYVDDIAHNKTDLVKFLELRRF